jgi:hypothetical protein
MRDASGLLGVLLIGALTVLLAMAMTGRTERLTSAWRAISAWR